MTAALPEAVPASTSGRGRGALVAAAVVAVAAYVALTVWTAPAFRGSDQYWYVEDTMTLMSGGPSATHELFPYSLSDADPDRGEPARPFVHNVPVLHVWAAAGRLLGSAEDGILAVNILCALLGAGFVGATVRRYAGEWTALAAAAAFLFVPVGFWVASQVLAETASGMLVAVALWLVVGWRAKPWSLLVAQVLLAVAAVGRIWVLPMLPLLALAALVFDGVRARRARVPWAVGALVLGAVVYLPLARAFPSHMPALDPMVIVLELSRTNNMLMYYRLGPAPAFDLGELSRGLARNVVQALKVQLHPALPTFAITRSAPWADRWPVNAAVLLAAGVLFLKGVDRERRYLMMLGVAGGLVHFGMAVVYLNQPRYVVAVLAPIVVAAAVALDLARTRARASARGAWAAPAVAAAAAAGLAVMLVVDVGNAGVYRKDALAHEVGRGLAVSLVDATVPPDARVVLDTRFVARWQWDWAVSPRPELALTTTFPYDDATYSDLVAEFGGDYLVADSTSRLPALLGGTRVGGSGDVTVYRLPR